MRMLRSALAVSSVLVLGLTACSATRFPSQFLSSDSKTSRIETGRREIRNPAASSAGSE